MTSAFMTWIPVGRVAGFRPPSTVKSAVIMLQGVAAKLAWFGHSSEGLATRWSMGGSRTKELGYLDQRLIERLQGVTRSLWIAIKSGLRRIRSIEGTLIIVAKTLEMVWFPKRRE